MIDYNEKIIWETKFSWTDVLGLLEPEVQELFESLDDEIKEELIDEYTHSISKGMEWGMMTDWTTVMSTAIDGCGIIEKLKSIFEDEDEQDQD